MGLALRDARAPGGRGGVEGYGLDVSVPYRLLCLNTWSLVSGAARGDGGTFRT